ncbi:MAG TPA: Ig-like domain-containing protein [Solirubrobacteraceae bacterium]|nr:Ig-like domain-containing protein [Solirubrobacteraceae bacterium]
MGSRLRHRRLRRALPGALLCALLALTLGLGAAPAASAAAEPGVVLADMGAPHIHDLKALGTHWVRLFATWRDLEPSPGYYAPSWLEAYEKLFRELPRGTKVIVDVVGTPQWETGSSDEHTPPANPEDYAAFVAGLAQRWGRRVAAYELWNEEDDSGWWTGAPDPVAYAALLRAAYPAIKAAEPRATVLVGGLTGNDYTYLEGLYRAGAKGYFDAVAVHTDTACNIVSPYSFLKGTNERMIPDSFLAFREVHDVMLANGDDKPIWMTELSWRTTSAECGEGYWAGRKAEGVTDTQQATYLRQAYHCLAQAPYVQVAIWFQLQDEGPVASGLLHENGTPKPAFAALAEYARHGDRLTQPCGDFSGPSIDISAPANHTSYSGTLPISVSAHDHEGVGRITLEIDGKLIRNYTNQGFPATLAGALHWHGAARIRPGRNVLTFIAVDKLRNISRRSLVIYHLVGGHSRHR